MMKSKQDNNVTNLIGTVYVKNETGLSWLIRLSEVSDENQIGQLHDQLYKSSICQKRNWVIVIDRTECDLWQKQN